MYAGTFQTAIDSDEHDHNLFYWLIKSKSVENAPLVLWLNGGPGATSMTGLFMENGPLRITKNGESNDDYILGLNAEGSWVDVADMIYLD